jgi:hypothetical protein
MSWQGYGAPASSASPQEKGHLAAPASRSGSTGLVVLVVALAAAATLIFTGAGIWVAVAGDTAAPASAAGSAPGAGQAGSPGPAGTGGAAPATPGPSAVTKVRPKVRGWTGIGSTKYRMAYDVPPSWQANDPGVIIGFEDRQAKILAAMSGSAEYKKGYCPSSRSSARAAAGFNGYVDGDLALVAKDAARKWAVAAYRPDNGPDPTVTLTTPRRLRVGGLRAVRVTANAAVRSRDGCDPPRGLAHAVALSGRGESKTTVFVIWADQSVSDAAADADLRKMIRSLRPLR